MIAVLLLGGMAGWKVRNAARCRLSHRSGRAGGDVLYDFEIDAQGDYKEDARPGHPTGCGGP